ncbi:hypothetical protein Tco_0880001 [Tanacetum coccineum]
MIVFEEQFQASSLLSPPSSDSEGDSVFEEEFIGPSLERNGYDGESCGERSSELGDSKRTVRWENEKVHYILSPRMHAGGLRNDCPKMEFLKKDIGSSPYDYQNPGISPRSSGLPPPPPPISIDQAQEAL